MTGGQVGKCTLCANPARAAYRAPDPDYPDEYYYFCSDEHRRFWERKDKILTKMRTGREEVTQDDLDFLERVRRL